MNDKRITTIKKHRQVMGTNPTQFMIESFNIDTSGGGILSSGRNCGKTNLAKLWFKYFSQYDINYPDGKYIEEPKPQPYYRRVESHKRWSR